LSLCCWEQRMGLVTGSLLDSSLVCPSPPPPPPKSYTTTQFKNTQPGNSTTHPGIDNWDPASGWSTNIEGIGRQRLFRKWGSPPEVGKNGIGILRATCLSFLFGGALLLFPSSLFLPFFRVVFLSVLVMFVFSFSLLSLPLILLASSPCLSFFFFSFSLSSLSRISLSLSSFFSRFRSSAFLCSLPKILSSSLPQSGSSRVVAGLYGCCML